MSRLCDAEGGVLVCVCVGVCVSINVQWWMFVDMHALVGCCGQNEK